MTGPVIEHWVVSVARGAGLDGVEGLHVDSGTATADAWSLVSMAARVGEEDLADVVARHFRLPRADLGQRDPHADRIVPARVARRLQVLPLRYSDRALVVASADPVDMEGERELTSLAGRSIQTEVAPPTAIRAALAEVYPEEDTEHHQVPGLMRDVDANPHLLVVDDDLLVRMLLRTGLEARGFRVTEAADGSEALQKLAEPAAAYDLVTLDLNMTQMHGLETLQRIRSSLKTADLPVIVATASEDSKIEMELFEAGADDYVIKPIDPPRFVLRVQAVLRRRRV